MERGHLQRQTNDMNELATGYLLLEQRYITNPAGQNDSTTLSEVSLGKVIPILSSGLALFVC